MFDWNRVLLPKDIEEIGGVFEITLGTEDWQTKRKERKTILFMEANTDCSIEKLEYNSAAYLLYDYYETNTIDPE